MPKEFVYKLTLDSADVKTTLSELDSELSNLGKKYQSAFDKVGSSLSKGAKNASGAAKKAVNEATAAQKKAEQAATRLEKAHIKLLAAELKLAVGSDKTAQNFIKQAAATATNVQGLAKAVVIHTDLTQAQVQQAQTVAHLRNQIVTLTASMTEEGSNVQQLSVATSQYQEILDRILASKEAEKQASLDSAAAKREEAAATAAVAEEPEEKIAATAGEVEDIGAIEIDTQQIEEAAEQLDELAEAAEESGDALEEASADAELAEKRYLKLLQAELRLAAGSDKVTQEFIKQAATGAETGETLLQAVSQTERLSQEQLEFADNIAKTKAEIIALTAEMDKEGADVEELSGQIGVLQGSLEKMNDEQQRAAAEAQAVADNMEEQAAAQKKAAADQDIAQKKSAKAAATTAATQRKANREFTKLAKSFPEIKQGLVELTGQYGTFKAAIGGTGAATGTAQRELKKLFRDNPKFAAELRRLTKEYGNFTATVNRSDFGPRMKSQGQQARQLGFALQRMGIQGVAAFGEIFAALGPMGIAVGAILVPLVAVTKALNELARTAKRVFTQLIKDSFEASKAFETTEAAFKAIFLADPTAVNFALRSTRDESERLGVALEELLPKILPKVSDLDQAFKVAELIPGLAASAIDLGPADALRSIIEALAGDLVSLRKAFEIDVSGIRKAQKEFGVVDGLIIGLTETLEGMGLSFADQSETIGIKIGQMEQKFQSFKLLVGAPIVDALKVQFEGLFGFLEANEPLLDNIASMIGLIVGQLTTDLGETIFDKLDDIDPQDIERIANALGSIADDFLGQASELALGFDEGGIADFFESIAGGVDTLADLIDTIRLLNDFLGLLSFGMVGAGKEGNFFTGVLGEIAGEVLDVGAAFDSLLMILGIVTGSMAGMAVNLKTLASNLDDVITGQMTITEAVAGAIEAGQEAMREQLEKTQRLLSDYEEVTLDAAAATNELGEESEDAANRILQLKNALKKLNEDEEDFLKKQEEINEAIREFAIAAELRFQGILTDMSRTLQKAAIDNSRKLIAIETKNRQKLDDIRGKFDDDVIDAGQDLSDKETDILRKHGRKLIEIEDDLAKARLKAEQKFRDELERIRAKFDFDAFEAMLGNDAKRLAQLRRRQAFEEKEAGKEKDRDLRDIDASAEDRKKALAKQLEEELQDARIMNARKIRDLSQNLQRQLDAQEVARQREVEAQALAERQKQNDLRTSLAQQLEDYDIWWKERHRVTTEGIQEDLEQLREWMAERNELLATIQSLSQVSNQIPLEELRLQTAERMNQALEQSMQSQMGQFPPGTEGAPLESFIGMTALELTATTLADLTREELEKAFDEASLQLGLPGLLEQQVLDLMSQQIENQGLHLTQAIVDLQRAALEGLSDDELKTLLAELTAELAGIELPAMPEGLEAAIPEGFSFPVVGQGPPQSGFFGAGGGLGSGVPGPPLPGGMGFPPQLPPEFAQFENFFLPGNLLPPPPTFGFDQEAFFNNLLEETEAQAAAELEKRGEIADTVDLAALLAEERSLLHASLMEDEVTQTKVASDAQIAILEATLEKQRVALDQIRGDEDLQADVEALETSIEVLEQLILDSKEAQAAASEEFAKAEVQTAEAAETDKRGAVDTTTDAIGRALRIRQQAAETSQQAEVAGARSAAAEELAVLEEGLAEQGFAVSEFRLAELEADSEHSETQMELFSETQQSMLEIQHSWWNELLRLQHQGIVHDLALMNEWLQQRLAMWQQMQMTMPGAGGVPDLPDGDGDGGSSNQSTLPELQQLAISQAEELGILNPVMQNDIMQMTFDEIVAFIEWLQEQLNPRQFGGAFLPNQLLRVGEDGEEIVSFNRAGRVDPVSSMMAFRPPSQPAGGGITNIDQSIQVGFDIPDPRGLTPVQIRAMENIAANVVKRSLVGKVR